MGFTSAMTGRVGEWGWVETREGSAAAPPLPLLLALALELLAVVKVESCGLEAARTMAAKSENSAPLAALKDCTRSV